MWIRSPEKLGVQRKAIKTIRHLENKTYEKRLKQLSTEIEERHHKSANTLEAAVKKMGSSCSLRKEQKLIG